MDSENSLSVKKKKKKNLSSFILLKDKIYMIIWEKKKVKTIFSVVKWYANKEIY